MHQVVLKVMLNVMLKVMLKDTSEGRLVRRLNDLGCRLSGIGGRV